MDQLKIIWRPWNVNEKTLKCKVRHAETCRDMKRHEETWTESCWDMPLSMKVSPPDSAMGAQKDGRDQPSQLCPLVVMAAWDCQYPFPFVPWLKYVKWFKMNMSKVGFHIATFLVKVNFIQFNMPMNYPWMKNIDKLYTHLSRNPMVWWPVASLFAAYLPKTPERSFSLRRSSALSGVSKGKKPWSHWLIYPVLPGI